MLFAANIDEVVSVIVVSGGGTGLTASMLLASGIEHLLVSARLGTWDLPKAHVINQLLRRPFGASALSAT